MRPAPRRPEAETTSWPIPPADDSMTIPSSAVTRNDSVQPIKPGRRRKRRRVFAIVGLVLLIPMLVLGVQGYRIIAAIGEAQRVAVVPLPTRPPRLAEGSTARLEPTATPQSSVVVPTHDAPPTVVATDRDDAVSPTNVTQPDPTETAPTATAPAPSDAILNVAPPLETGASIESIDGNEDEDGGDELSSFDVVRELAEAGTDRGDPGLDGVWGGQTELTIMVLGVDRRPDGGDENADVIMLVRLDLVAKSIEAVSIPRDLLVSIPNHGEGKINGAYNVGVIEHPDHPAAGVAMMRDTIEDNFGVVIDDYVLLDFQGFEEAIDAVGGVEIAVPYLIVDDAYPTEDYGTEVVTFEPGLQDMDGETALKYARTRNVDSDDGRRERQADILLALFDEAKDLGSITQANRIILALGDTVQTSFHLEQQLTLARIGLDMVRTAITMEAIPETMLTEGYDDNGAWVYFADIGSVASFIQDELGLAPRIAG